jgi:hypothetical protein
MQPVMASSLISPRLGSSSLRKGHYLLRGGRFCLKLCNTAKRGSLCQRLHPHSPRLRSAPHMLHSPLHLSWQRGFMGMLSHTCSSTISLTSIPSSGIKLMSMSSCNSSLSSSLGASFIRRKHSLKSHSIGRENSFRHRAQRSDSAVLIRPVTSIPLGVCRKKSVPFVPETSATSCSASPYGPSRRRGGNSSRAISLPSGRISSHLTFI